MITLEPKNDGAARAFDDSAERNDLLRGLPIAESERIHAELEMVTLPLKHVIAEPEHRIEDVYFPQSAVVSYVTLLSGTGGVEAHTIGSDGMVGISLMNEVDNTSSRIIVQIPGDAKRMATTVFREVIEDCPELRHRLRRYSQLVTELVSQTAACNRMHVTEERCARWLLMSHDRTGRDQFQLTQGFLAQMLGVRRPGVTVAIGILERAGLIAHERGVISVLDRAGLEAASCECYATLRRRHKALLGSSR